MARQQWREGGRRLEGLRGDPALYHRLHVQVDAVTAELRRRVGRTFSLGQLADAYRAAEPWVLDAVEERDDEPGWQRHVALVLDASFDLYSRGATDYRP